MLKKLPWKTVLLTLFAWMLFWEVKETLSGERRFFVVRWLYSNKSFSKNIEVQTYLLTDEQVSYILLHPNEVIQQPTNRMLNKNNVNILFRIRNKGLGVTWGKLKWRMYASEWHIVDVSQIPMQGAIEKYAQIIIPIGNNIAYQNDELPEPVEVEWETFNLYQ